MSWWLLCCDLVVLNFVLETFFLLVLSFCCKGGNQQVISSTSVFSGILHAEGTPLDVAGVVLGLLGLSEKLASSPSLLKKRHGRRKSVYYDDFRKKYIISQITSLLFKFLKPKCKLAVGCRHCLDLLVQRVRRWLAEPLCLGFPAMLLDISFMLYVRQEQSKGNGLFLWQKAVLRGSSPHRPSHLCFDRSLLTLSCSQSLYRLKTLM